MADGDVPVDGATSDGEVTDGGRPKQKAEASSAKPIKKKEPAPTSKGRKKDAVSQILKAEIMTLAVEKKRLNENRSAISVKIRKPNRRRRRLLKKLRTTPTEDLVLMIRARERGDMMEKACAMASDTAGPSAE
jgi:hypothetical protein